MSILLEERRNISYHILYIHISTLKVIFFFLYWFFVVVVLLMLFLNKNNRKTLLTK